MRFANLDFWTVSGFCLFGCHVCLCLIVPLANKVFDFVFNLPLVCCVWGLLFEPLHTYLWCWALCTTFKCGHVEQLQNMHVFDETTYKRTLLKHNECHTDALPHMPEFCFKSNIIFCVNQILTEISTAAAQSSLPPCFYSIFIIMAKEWMRKQMQRTLVFSKNQTKSFMSHLKTVYSLPG